MIAVVDYGAGNLGSVDKALRYLGIPSSVTSDPDSVVQADALIVPGVGAFGHCMAGLRRRGLETPVLEFIRSGRPFLGICVGMQMLFAHSEEGGQTPGLGVVAGSVRRFEQAGPRAGLKVPHMGWNAVEIRRPCPLFRDLPDRPMVYFVHSYYCLPAEPSVVAGETDYGGWFCSAVEQRNVLAVQFHPEKSGDVGLAMLRNFAALTS